MFHYERIKLSRILKYFNVNLKKTYSPIQVHICTYTASIIPLTKSGWDSCNQNMSDSKLNWKFNWVQRRWNLELSNPFLRKWTFWKFVDESIFLAKELSISCFPVFYASVQKEKYSFFMHPQFNDKSNLLKLNILCNISLPLFEATLVEVTIP